ncbi:pyrophosphatase PpaX [Haloplasma contractile]|uniref:Pyrophosphatase PpaX protein n=1 Tax=Haloplasma contractile SSD-17B TaxID=1033810 RepID=U2ED88_9MOLU|nr:pyrophosphatase PpaX [Haloplasma contractile]ERJ10960.1 Pyrophosphatase PpaX protein [Haloplasma contractile SSD-17B]ERJ12968.1 Pyrophosphatase PpaX protein [Haloplasma contractile SSD-17B]
MNENKNITTVLFDLDGTLINTNPLIISSFRATVEEFLKEQTFTDEDLMDFIGPTLEQTFTKLLKEKKDDMITFYRTHNKKYHDDMVEVYPGVLEGLERLKQKGITLGIVSSKANDMVHHGLKHCKIYDYFEIIIGADDVTNPKPHKEPIELALNRLGRKKEETIFVGDNKHDMLGGKNAGVITCGVSWALRGADYLKNYHPEFILKDMNDLLKIIDEVNTHGK